MERDTIAHLCGRWALLADGPQVATASSTLVPVRCGARRAMLKLAHSLEEARGGKLMQWWGGDGAAPVLARHGSALLLVRADGGSLAAFCDDLATPILVRVAARLARAGGGRPPRLVPLRRWFRALWPAARRHGGVLAEAAAIAMALLDDRRDEGVLHGDLHHGNVLDFGPDGWLAIDPKGLWGERGFEFVALFRNPDAARALAAGRLEHEATRVAELAGLERGRLLAWIAAGAALAAAWTLSDGGTPDADLALIRRALAARGS